MKRCKKPCNRKFFGCRFYCATIYGKDAPDDSFYVLWYLGVISMFILGLLYGFGFIK